MVSIPKKKKRKRERNREKEEVLQQKRSAVPKKDQPSAAFSKINFMLSKCEHSETVSA